MSKEIALRKVMTYEVAMKIGRGVGVVVANNIDGTK